jgi:hypothetical protein
MLKAHRAPPGTDAVILAGDTHPGVLGVMWAAEAFAGLPVLYLPGNHEFYGRRRLDRHVQTMREKAAGTCVTVVDRDTAVIAGTRFICATLWTDYALQGDQVLAMLRAQAGMNDYRRICSTLNHDLRPADLLREHGRSRAYIAGALAVPHDGPTVVVTHHAPSGLSLPPHRVSDGLSPCYASSLEDLMLEYGPEMWIHGHIHHPQDYMVGATRVIANPRGYVMAENRGPAKRENPEWVADMLVCVGPQPAMAAAP